MLRWLVPLSILLSSPVAAEFAKVDDETQFKALVSGAVLTRPLVRLSVSPEGGIRGIGAKWEVEGSWSWQNGFFCRDLYWGGSNLGYNCQEVRVKGAKIRFTSDRGRGRSADFRLRRD